MEQSNKKLMTCRRSGVRTRVRQFISVRNQVNAVKKIFTAKIYLLFFRRFQLFRRSATVESVE